MNEPRPVRPPDEAGASRPSPTRPGGSVVRSPFQDTYQPSRFEDDLLFLISNLEQSVAGLDEVRPDKKPATATRMACAVIEQVFSFSYAKLNPESHTSAFDKAQQAYESAQALEPVLRSGRLDPNQQFAYQAVGRMLRDGLSAYFLIFAGCFQDHGKSKQWMATFKVLLDDLKGKW